MTRSYFKYHLIFSEIRASSHYFVWHWIICMVMQVHILVEVCAVVAYCTFSVTVTFIWSWFHSIHCTWHMWHLSCVQLCMLYVIDLRVYYQDVLTSCNWLQSINNAQLLSPFLVIVLLRVVCVFARWTNCPHFESWTYGTWICNMLTD